LTVFTGKSGVDVTELSYYGSEIEVLIKPYTTFKIVNVVPENGFIRCEIEETI